jgi:hypothetical protein
MQVSFTPTRLLGRCSRSWIRTGSWLFGDAGPSRFPNRAVFRQLNGDRKRRSHVEARSETANGLLALFDPSHAREFSVLDIAWRPGLRTGSTQFGA